LSDYVEKPTSVEVYRAITNAHPELVLFSSYSAPEGDIFNYSVGKLETSLGFNNCDFPIIKAKTTWDIDKSAPEKRNNIEHQYWLCVGRLD
jgi:hypothetical protein